MSTCVDSALLEPAFNLVLLPASFHSSRRRHLVLLSKKVLSWLKAFLPKKSSAFLSISEYDMFCAFCFFFVLVAVAFLGLL